MTIIKAAEVESKDFHRITEQLFDDMLLFKKCMTITMHTHQHIGEVARNVALYISQTGKDFIFSAEEKRQIIS